jgi:hypothetical protein
MPLVKVDFSYDLLAALVGTYIILGALYIADYTSD